MGEGAAMMAEVIEFLDGRQNVPTPSSVLVSSSRWLNNPRIRDWVMTECLRRNGLDHPLLDDLGGLVGAVDQARDRDRVEQLIKAERQVNPALDGWFSRRFVSTYSVQDLGAYPAGSLGRQLHDQMVRLNLTLELLPQRRDNPDWAPAADLDYFTLRTGQTHDFDHLIGEVGFDAVAEAFTAGLRTGNMFAHVGAELAGELLVTNTLVTFPWFFRTMLHYPQAWPQLWHNFSHGHEVGAQSPCLFTVKWEDYLHLSPAQARAALGVQGFRGANDSTQASRVFGEGRLIF